MDSNKCEEFKLPTSTDLYFPSEAAPLCLSGDINLTSPDDSKWTPWRILLQGNASSVQDPPHPLLLLSDPELEA